MIDKNNYEVLSGDVIVAIWQNNNLFIKNKTLLPLCLKYCCDANLWLESRAIDNSRANSRLLKKHFVLLKKMTFQLLLTLMLQLLQIIIGLDQSALT